MSQFPNPLNVRPGSRFTTSNEPNKADTRFDPFDQFRDAPRFDDTDTRTQTASGPTGTQGSGGRTLTLVEDSVVNGRRVKTNTYSDGTKERVDVGPYLEEDFKVNLQNKVQTNTGFNPTTHGQRTDDPDHVKVFGNQRNSGVQGRDPIVQGTDTRTRGTVSDTSRVQTALTPTRATVESVKGDIVPLGGNSGDPTKDVGFGDFFKASDDVGKLTPEEQAEAERILREQGAGEFARYVAEKSVKAGGGSDFSEDTLRSSVNSLKAFEGGGFEDFYRIADLESIINDPNTTDEDRAAAEAERDNLLANPTEGANARSISTSPAGSNDKLNAAIKAVQSAGSSGIIDGTLLEVIEELDEDGTLTTMVKTIVDDQRNFMVTEGAEYDELIRRGLAGEGIVDDAGFGVTHGGIPNPPPNVANNPMQMAGWYLNQALARARHGIINRDTRQYLKILLDRSTGGGEDGVARLDAAFEASKVKKQETLAAKSAELNKSKAAGLEAALLKKQAEDAEKARLAQVERTRFGSMRNALDKLLSGQDLSAADLDGLDDESISRIEALRKQTVENEIRRRETTLQDRARQFEESRFQVGAAVEEKSRVRGVNENLTTDVATTGMTPGGFDRTISSFEKAERGIMPTEAELFDLTADQRAQLQNLAIQKSNQLNLANANTEVQLEARKRLLNPNTVGSGAQVFGQGNANQFFGRNAMSGIEQRLSSDAEAIRVNADTQRAAEKNRINTQIDAAQTKLARVFADPNTGGLSGAAQRRFEELEAGRASALNEIDTRVDAQTRAETRENMGLLLGLQESREGASVAANQINQGNLGQILGFAQGQDQLSLSREELLGRVGSQNTLARDAQDLTGEIQRGQLGLSRDQLQLEKDQAIGRVDGVQTIAGKQMDLQDFIQRGQLGLSEAELFGGTQGIDASGFGVDLGSIMDDSGQLVEGATIDQYMRAITDIEGGFQQARGRAPTAGEMISLMGGGTIGGRDTLAGRAAALNENISVGDRTGYVTDPKTGIRLQTLAGKANIREDKQFGETVRTFNAQFFGDALDENGNIKEGLDKEKWQETITQFNRQMDLSERETMSSLQQGWAQITGNTGPGPVDANTLGIDVSSFAGQGKLPPAALLRTQEAVSAKEAFAAMTGRAATDNEILGILNGETLNVEGAPTLATRELSTRITQGNMDRATQIKQFADNNDLQWEQVTQAIDESDRQWALTTQDIAEVIGIDPGKWQSARSEWEKAKEEGLSDTEADNRARQRSGLSSAEFIQANNLFEERFGAAERTAAANAEMTDEQWQATKDAKKKMDDREDLYWNGIMGGRGTDIGASDLQALLSTPENAPDEFKRGGELDNIMMTMAVDKAKFGSTGEAQSVVNDFLDFVATNPEDAQRQLTRMFESDLTVGEDGAVTGGGQLKDVDLSKLEGKGFNRGLVRLLDNGGDQAAAAARDALGAIARTMARGDYAPPSIHDMDEGKLLELLTDRYGAGTATIENVQNILSGNTFKIIPEDWIDSFQPEGRMELLSLIHGGASFNVAQQQPSLGQSIGSFASNALMGTIASGGDPVAGIFSGLFGPKDNPPTTLTAQGGGVRNTGL